LTADVSIAQRLHRPEDSIGMSVYDERGARVELEPRRLVLYDPQVKAERDVLMLELVALGWSQVKVSRVFRCRQGTVSKRLRSIPGPVRARLEREIGTSRERLPDERRERVVKALLEYREVHRAKVRARASQRD